MIIIYYFFLLLSFWISFYSLYVIYSVLTKKETFLWKVKIDKMIKILFKDMFETKLKPYERYKEIIFVIILSFISSIFLSICWNFLVSNQVSNAQSAINAAAKNYSNLINANSK